MKGVCSLLLHSSPDSEEDEQLPGGWELTPRWHGSGGGSCRDPGGRGTAEHPQGPWSTSAEFLGVQAVLPKAPAPSLPRSPLPQGLCSQAESPQGDIVSLQALCRLSLSCPLPLTLQEGRAGRGILFPISCSPLPRAIPRDFAGLAYSRVVVLAGSLS